VLSRPDGRVAGSQNAFIAIMNRIAAWLGLTQTHYANPHGLDAPDHYTTARDLARLAAFALTLPLFRQIVAQSRYTIPASASHPAIALVNSNVLLIDGTTLGVDGVKTGFTGNAGYCLVLDARRQGHELIAVLLGDPTGDARFTDGAALLQWGFSNLPTIMPNG
jgi:serine-type D-Ala-D-Ala carboxypeptidase (penicillin-binding protein 5/6)